MLLHLTAKTMFTTIYKALGAVRIEGFEEACRLGVFVAFTNSWILRFCVFKVTFINELYHTMTFTFLLSHLI